MRIPTEIRQLILIRIEHILSRFRVHTFLPTPIDHVGLQNRRHVQPRPLQATKADILLAGSKTGARRALASTLEAQSG